MNKVKEDPTKRLRELLKRYKGEPHEYVERNWMYDGVEMTAVEFAHATWPEDCPDKTAFVLKYSE